MGYFFFILDQLCLQHHSYGHNSHHRNRKNSHCKPHCDVLHSKCVRDYFGGTRKNSFSCRCLPGFAPTYLPANSILYSSQRRLVFCQPTMTNGTLQGSASAGGVLANNGLFAHNATVPFKYYPGKIDTVSILHRITGESINHDMISKVYTFMHLNFSEDTHLNHWMLAMIGIGCVFIAFVGVSIYLMW